MTSKFRSGIALFLGVILILSLAGCTSKNSSASTNSNGKVELTLWTTWADGTATSKLYNNEVKKFNDNHKNIVINLRTTPHDQYKTKLKTQAAGKQLPDLFQVWAGAELKPLVQGGNVAPINSITDNLSVSIPKSTLSTFAFNGKQYAIPSELSYTSVIYYDRDILAKVGYNTFPKTYSDFKDLINKLNAKGITPIELGDKAAWPFQSCYLSAIADRVTGSDFLQNIADGKAKYTDPQFIKAVSVLQELIQMHTFNKDTTTIDTQQSLANFLNGKSAMYVSGSWDTSSILADKPDGKNISAALFPKIEGGKGDPTKTSGVGTTAIAINSDLKGNKKEAAMEFIKYFYGDKNLYKALLKEGTMPSAKVDSSGSGSALFNTVNSLATGGISPVYDQTIPEDETQIINSGLQSLLSGSTTPEKIANDMEQNR
jgi:raffinose/stachyose/melibiose transport system substrate-binding protein